MVDDRRFDLYRVSRMERQQAGQRNADCVTDCRDDVYADLRRTRGLGREISSSDDRRQRLGSDGDDDRDADADQFRAGHFDLVGVDERDFMCEQRADLVRSIRDVWQFMAMAGNDVDLWRDLYRARWERLGDGHGHGGLDDTAADRQHQRVAGDDRGGRVVDLGVELS